MTDTPSPTEAIGLLLEQLRAGKPSAAEALIEHSLERLRRLTRRMLGDSPAVRRWHETDDVLQNASMRLLRALKEVKPESPRAFMGLAATQIRRELIDLARHDFGPHGDAGHHATDPALSPIRSGAAPLHAGADDASGPLTQLQWQEFHEQVQRLPGPEREVFELIFYQGLSQDVVARLLDVSVPTIKRRWRSARLALSEAASGDGAP